MYCLAKAKHPKDKIGFARLKLPPKLVATLLPRQFLNAALISILKQISAMARENANMASLRDQLNADYKTAFKAKEELKISVLRMLLSAVKNKEFEKRGKLSKTETDAAKLEKESQLNDEEILTVISTEAKRRKDSIAQYETGGRPELAKKEKEELDVLQKYLPAQMGEDEIRKFVKEAIGKSGAAGAQDIGKVMKELMPHVKGKADGALVNKIVKEELGS